MRLSIAKRILAHVILPLAIGTLVYVLFRDRHIPIAGLFGDHSLNGVAPPHNALARVVIGTLPDFAWAWSFGAAIALVWGKRPLRESLTWFIAGGTVAAMTEVGQAFGLVSGTFDRIDLVAIVAGYVMGAVVAHHRASRPNDITDSA